MTLFFEKFNAIKWTRKNLWDKFTDESNDSDLVTLTREEVYRMLKHYPDDDWIEKLERLYVAYLNERREEKNEFRFWFSLR